MEPSACEGNSRRASSGAGSQFDMSASAWISNADICILTDLKAFERRLTEVVSSYKPSTLRFRIVLAVISLCTAIGAWYWLRDPRTSLVPLLESLLFHPIFTLSTLALIVLFIFGIHKLVIAPQIITSRMRNVLCDFNMSCDDTGKLILKPRPNNN